MDIFDIHNVKMEKANAMLVYQSFRNIAKLFRLVELFLALVFMSWISSRLPFFVRLLGDYFRQLLSVVVSPLFIFLIGNVIILILVVKSGQIAGNPVAIDNVRSDLYEEVPNNERLEGLEREEAIPIPISTSISPVVVADQSEEIVYHDKRIVSEADTNPNQNPKPKPNPKPITPGYGYWCDESKNKHKIELTEARKQRLAISEPDLDLKTYRRSQSENLTKNNSDFPKLRRSETGIGRRTVETPAVDRLSNEEFQRRIEGFIARQVRFHHEEKLAIVVPHCE